MTEFFGTGNHFCHVHRCHSNTTDVLVHGQEIIIDGQEIILERLEAMAATLAQVQADYAKEKDDNTKFRGDVKDAFARLQASIDANTLDPQALQDLDDTINGDDADVNSADADAQAEGVTPADAGAPVPAGAEADHNGDAIPAAVPQI